MSRFVLNRTLEALTLFAGILVISFLLFRVAPGDTARTILGPNATEEAVTRLRRDLGTDQPVGKQLVRQSVGVLSLNLGRSAIDGRDVASEVVTKFAVTARLAALSSGISLVLSYAFSFSAFRFRAPWITYFSRVGAVTPTYCSGVLAALAFGVVLPWAPLSGYGADGDHWSALLLPATVAAFYPLAAMTGILSERIREASEEGFARTAEAYGHSRSAIYHRTLLPAIWIPWLAAWINQIGVVFVASFVLEVIFTIPGTGVLMVHAIQQKDYPILQGILLLNGAFFIIVNWVATISFRTLDPRLA